MKLVTYDAGAGPRAGVVSGDWIVDLAAASDGALPADMAGVLAQDETLASVRGVLERADSEPAHLPRKARSPLGQARLLAPVPRPGKVPCLGLNYSEHAAESGFDAPTEPVVFCKAASSVIGPGEPILLPEASGKVDYEVELAVVIGRRARSVSAAEALDYVAGYTVLQDVSARDYQLEKAGGQWYLGKSFDTFCPLGPWLVTKDEIPDPQALALECEVISEGARPEVLQSSSTSRMIFPVAAIVEYLSRVFTLEPGDVIGTGTPSGVGMSRTPPRFLRAGDVVRCTVEGIGTLENPVR